MYWERLQSIILIELYVPLEENVSGIEDRLKKRLKNSYDENYSSLLGNINGHLFLNFYATDWEILLRIKIYAYDQTSHRQIYAF